MTSPELMLGGNEEELWLRAVKEGERRADVVLGTLLEQLLVMTLMACNEDTALCRVVATEFAKGDSESLIKVASRCLIIAGLFPALARRRNVRVGYFFDIGVGAYHAHANYWGARGRTGYAYCSQTAAQRFPDLVGALRGMKGSSNIPDEIRALTTSRLQWN